MMSETETAPTMLARVAGFTIDHTALLGDADNFISLYNQQQWTMADRHRMLDLVMQGVFGVWRQGNNVLIPVKLRTEQFVLNISYVVRENAVLFRYGKIVHHLVRDGVNVNEVPLLLNLPIEYLLSKTINEDQCRDAGITETKEISHRLVYLRRRLLNIMNMVAGLTYTETETVMREADAPVSVFMAAIFGMHQKLIELYDEMPDKRKTAQMREWLIAIAQSGKAARMRLAYRNCVAINITRPMQWFTYAYLCDINQHDEIIEFLTCKRDRDTHDAKMRISML